MSNPGYQPAWRITTASKDITAWLDRFVREVEIIDDAGIESDRLKLVCADGPGFIAPQRGAELHAAIGYADASLADMGVFRVRQVRHEGPPDKVVIVANAVHHGSEQKTKHTRTYVGSNLGNVLRNIAATYGLEPAIDAGLAALDVKYIEQKNESDSALLKRLGKQHQAYAAIKRGKLIFKPIGTVHSVTGKPLPTISIDKSDLTRWTITEDDKAKYSSVRVRWHDVDAAVTHDVALGEGAPEYLHPEVVGNKADAEQRAKALLKKHARAAYELELECAGRTDLVTEAGLVLTGLPTWVKADWTITKVIHRLNTKFTTTIEHKPDT